MVTLPTAETHVRTARKFTAAVLTHWQVSAGDNRDCAVLVVSELSTNAVQHGRSAMTVRLVLRGRSCTSRLPTADCRTPRDPRRATPTPSNTGAGWAASRCWRTGSPSGTTQAAGGWTPDSCWQHCTTTRSPDRHGSPKVWPVQTG
ncbi:ATP-binding protein [Streptomyces sp. ID05-39B]|uniref:ATP-binding protein n=1 Tax=Streptomyces sp. ID05-39B TaxID=3028664 RepID=UPI0034DAFF37